jgi:hypothetical protein
MGGCDPSNLQRVFGRRFGGLGRLRALSVRRMSGEAVSRKNFSYFYLPLFPYEVAKAGFAAVFRRREFAMLRLGSKAK